jgi:Zn-dependent protease
MMGAAADRLRMLRFKIFGIPIEVHLSHLLIVAILGHVIALWGLPPEAASAGNTTAPTTADPRALWLSTARWAFAISAAAFTHELGHSLVALHFGYRPTIHLIGLGGLTRPHPNETLPWQREAAIIIGGSTLGFTTSAVAFLLAWLLKSTLAEGAAPVTAMGSLSAACGIWAALNLIPVPPLDGGRLAGVLLVRWLGRRGFAVAQLVALLFAVAVLAFSASRGEWLLIVFFGLYLARVLVLLRGYFSGALPKKEVHPFDLTYAAAASLYDAQRYDAARQTAEGLLEADVQPALRSRLHGLLGWVSLKNNQGRAALDHFAQVHGDEIPAEALAAAFSLVGDDERALPLWQKAVAGRDDPTLRHEWAGTYLRLGQLERARAMPQVQLPLAYLCAERVFEARGDFNRAGTMLEQSCALAPRAATAFDAACHFARAGNDEKAFALLELALELGFDRGDLASGEPALSQLRSHQRFVSWLSRVQKSKAT